MDYKKFMNLNEIIPSILERARKIIIGKYPTIFLITESIIRSSRGIEK